MNKRLTLAGMILMLFFSGSAAHVAFGQTAQRVEAIKKIYQKTNEAIALSEQSPDASTTFLTELTVNKNLSPYPAVGIYKTVAKFYYTFGDREVNPYPDRLMKIVLSTDRSDRKEYSEFLFDEAGQLVFYAEKKDDVERRLYLTSERPIRLQQAELSLPLRSRAHSEFVATVMKEKTNLVAIFRRSLGF